MKIRIRFTTAALVALVVPSLFAQQTPFQRLNPKVFDVLPPSARIRGTPGTMTVQRSACRILPTADVRRHIVNIAVQEWAFFGFSMVEPDEDEFDLQSFDWRSLRFSPEESLRVASSIAGYWAVTPAGSGIVTSQNRLWNGPEGIGARWVAPWSAAFVSWIMCESGLGSSDQFQRAIAHHVYIDQAIRARDGSTPEAAFVAYDPGDAVIEPGDLLCTSRRPAYRSLAERRRQLGEGARTHCDIVIKIDAVGQRILTIGGNVRRSVSMKTLPAVRDRRNNLRPIDQSVPDRVRPFFAHLRLRANSIEANAFDNSPTIKALDCASGFQRPTALSALSSTAVTARRC